MNHEGLIMKTAIPAFLLLGLVLLAGTAFAQDATPPTKLRGTLAGVDGQKLELKSRSGEKISVTLTPDARVTGLIIAPASAIKSGSFIGVTAIPQADGTLKATEVHVFPESMRGAGEGHYPWDRGGKKSTMTNGTVGNIVKASGQTLTVKYANGEKQIVVPPNVPIVTFEPGDASLLKRGAHVMIFAKKAADGSFTADGVTVGKNGVVPPM
jgi:hypothetical protein